MRTAVLIGQVIAALGIFNVWILRFRKPTNWRGGEAKTLTEEFQVYGLPGWSVVVIGFLKLLFAALLLAGIWLPALSRPAAVGLGILMVGAAAMHFKVKDPPQRALPALGMLALCVLIAFGS
ncbi:MAG: DoxX family protein [Zetaproteobacteria bacterium]|nr:MAG: DoxX family protein [Zetaproteobacteria bacterium]